MPFDEADRDDPMMLVGAVVPGDAESERQMALAVIDEYVRLGFSRAQLFQLFADPHFQMTHRFYRRAGPAEVRSLIEEVLRAWGAPEGADRAFDPGPEWAAQPPLVQIRKGG